MNVLIHSYSHNIKFLLYCPFIPQDILTEVHLYVHRIDLPQKIRIHLLIKLAELENRLLLGASEKIQLGSLLSAFQITRDMVAKQGKAS